MFSNMFSKLMIPVSLLCVSMLGEIGHSAIVLRVDMDLSSPGVQANVERSPGATVNAGLMMELTGTTSLAIYTFSVEFDRNELTFLSRNETPDVLTGLSELDTTNGNNISTGQLYRFDGGTFASGPVGPLGPVKVGEISFTAQAPSGTATDIDITPGLFQPLFDSFFDNASNEITSQVTFIGGSVSFTSIPEPVSMVLVVMGGVVATFVGRRRTKSKPCAW